MEHESDSHDYYGYGGCQHLFASNCAGTGTGRVEVWCVRCGAQEIYYDDTGTVLYSELDSSCDNERYTGVIHTLEELNDSIRNNHICERYADERNVCLVCGKQLEPKPSEKPAAPEPATPPAASGEKLYIVKETGHDYEIVGFEARCVAEQQGLRHLTVIIVPFVADGPEKERWIVHDRTAKLWAKGKAVNTCASLNLFGGHCSADEEAQKRLGQLVTMDIFDAAAKRELEEELLCQGKGQFLEGWKSKAGPSGSREATQYEHFPLISIDEVTYNGEDNKEVSFLYALPVPAADVDALLAADNYERDGKEHDIVLPILRMREDELKRLHKHNPDVEICDAISRLWLRENRAANRKLNLVIQAYCKGLPTKN